MRAQRADRRAWVDRARALKPLLADRAAEIERTQNLPADVRAAMHDAGLFKLIVPRAYGGAELDPATFAQVVAAVAEGDGSVAWCMGQTAGCSTAAAYLDPAVAREVFGAHDAAFSYGFPVQPCHAVPVEGGWRVTGRWTFASGNRVSRWLGGHCVLCDADGTPRRHANGAPVERTMVFPRASGVVHEDRWDVFGLIGTGSDVYEVQDLFVPTAYSHVPRAVPRDLQLPDDALVDADPERRETGTLYRFSSQAIFQAGLTSVAAGIARGMIDEFIALARQKNPSSALQPLRADTWIHARLAQADAKVNAATAWVEKAFDEAWEEAEATGRISLAARMKIRSACTWQSTESRDAVAMLWQEAGATAIFRSNPFERRFRDIHTVTQQVQSNIARMQMVGQYLLGIPPAQTVLLP